MKKYLLVPAVVLFAACGNTVEDDPTDSSNGPKTTCYFRSSGQDTTAIRMTISGNEVTGELKYLPWQKDPRVGNIAGHLKDDVVTVDWNCTQEGMEFTVPVCIKLKNGKAMMQQNDINEQGEEFVPEKRNYSIEYAKMDCSIFPERDY